MEGKVRGVKVASFPHLDPLVCTLLIAQKDEYGCYLSIFCLNCLKEGG